MHSYHSALHEERSSCLKYLCLFDHSFSDGLNQDYFTKLYGEYEVVCQNCLEEVDTIREDLIQRGVCTSEKAQQVVTDKCLPLVGETQSNFEKELEIMDVSYVFCVPAMYTNDDNKKL